MSALSKHMATMVSQGSLIRRMFDAGIIMKKEFGEDQVCDFSLGNPDLAPPAEVAAAMHALADQVHMPASLGYMPNAGFLWAREALAAWLSKQQGVALGAQDVMLGCGAAGVMNALFRSILEPGDEVLGIAPYFVEYGFYADNHGGVFKPVPSRKNDFGPDFAAIEAALNPKVRAFIVNSPNNPTGAVYSLEDLKTLAKLLADASQRFGRPIYLVADEPYRFLAYDGLEVPALLPLYSHAVVLGSFSKNLCLAGERVGYIAVNPTVDEKELLMSGLIMANRILGFVNPPVVGQYLMKAALNASTTEAVRVYTRRRNRLAEILSAAGYQYTLPKGAFYFFPEAPGGDDNALVERLTAQRILAVPGRGFGCPGYIRLSFAVDDAIIERSAEGFKKAHG